MHELRHTFGMRRKVFLSIAALTSLAIPIAFGAARAMSIQTQSQPSAFNPSDFKFDVVSIKPNKSGTDAFEVHNPFDAFGGTNYSLEMLIHDAYGIYEEYRYLGAPNWVSSDRYDIEMKLDSVTADRLQTLSSADRKVAWEHMIQTVLSERFGLKAHRDTREFPVYFLVVAKGGPKLRESKPNPDDPKAPKNAVWHESMKNGMMIMPAQLMPIEQLASRLSSIVGRVVLDRTGLPGRYDFTLQFADERSARPISVGTGNGQPVPSAQDPDDVSVFKALQDQLGLKLESGKGPIEIIVIDHIERASGN